MKLCFQSNLNAWSSKRAEAVPIRVTNNSNNMLFIIEMSLILVSFNFHSSPL